MMHRALIAIGLSLSSSAAFAQTQWPNMQEADYMLRGFTFADGQTLRELRLHYMTFGTAKKNAAGEITNAVVLLHGTSGSGKSWLTPTLADGLFAKGEPLDASQFFMIVPDSIGVGGSSKPSDGLRAKFPHYRYHDIVEAEHKFLTEGLGIKHVRLVMGASMGGMQTWMWGEMYPDLMDGLVPIASQPVPISGRNWMMRRVRIEAIKHDPDYNGGNYEKNPTHWVWTAPMGPLMTENVQQWQLQAPTLEKGDDLYNKMVEDAKKADANNSLYGIEAVMDYDPSKDLEKIKARLLAVNFEDDEANPPELGTVEPAMKRIANAKNVVIPASRDTHGHYTYFRANFWKAHLADFMKTLPAAK